MTRERCHECGLTVLCGEVVIPLFRVNYEREAEPFGHAHAYHFRNQEADEDA